MFLFRLLKNKYFLTIAGLLAWLLFFDKNDVFTQYELVSKCNKLEKDKNYYLDEIRRNRESLNALKTDPDHLERFAREKYLMKRDNEDVFVFVTR